MVIPRSRSSGALSIWSNATNSASPFFAWILVIAAVNVVFPWSTCPIVPTFTWCFVRSNLALAMTLTFHFRHDFFCLCLWYFLIMTELHAVDRPALAHRPQRRRVAEHLRQGHARRDDVGVGALGHPADLAAAARQVADDLTHVVGRRHDLDVHDRLEQDRMGLARGLFHGHRAGDLER